MQTFKMLFIFILFSICSFPSFSDETEKEDIFIQDEVCFNASSIAGRFMEMRQNENSISKTLFLAKTLSNGNKELYQLFRHLIILAYEEKVEDSEIKAERKIRNFSDKIVVDCLKEIQEKEDIDFFKLDEYPKNWKEYFSPENK